MNQNQADGSPNPNQVDEAMQREIDEALAGQSIEQMMDDAAPPTEAAAGDATNADESGDTLSHELKRGRIAAIRAEEVFVELAGIGKTQGIISLQQFERPPRIGSIMDFVVTRFDEAEGLYHLSREGAIGRATWDQITKGSAVEARVVGSNKGGLELEMVGSVRAFMPASQVDIGRVEDLSTMVGQKVQAIVQELDRKAKRVVLSRRQYLEKQREMNKGKVLATLELDQIREGVISSVMAYGAFVDLGGIDGLIHVSDISYTRIEDPATVLKVGDKVNVKVLKIDLEKGRISLGLKQIEPDPWSLIAQSLRIGDQVNGRVTRTAPFGAFVEVDKGVEGLCPISELSWKRVNKVEDVVTADQVHIFKILEIDPAKRRLSLSLKQAGGDPWVGATVTYAPKSIVEGTVLSCTEFGAFIELKVGVEGLVHISELDNKRVNQVTDVLKPGEVKQFRVLTVDEDQRRISLSLKQVAAMTEDVRAAERAAYEERQAAAGGSGGAKPGTAAAPAKRKPAGNMKGGLGKSGALGMGLGDLKL